MNESPGEPSFRERVAAEVRVQLARQQVSSRELSRRLGRSQSWASRRLTATAPFSTDDLESVAEAIGVPVSDLIPD